MTNKEFDLIVFGATSFVGKILCDYLVMDHNEPNLSWAMAARSESKLGILKEKLGPSGANIPLIIADSFDEASLRALCKRTHVIISTIGPYALYGDLLIKVCADIGTDYCDLTGEAPWIRRMIEEYGDAAKTSGARIVNCCGYDSIPSDIGVSFLQKHAESNFGSYCEKVHMRLKASKGGPSGGTIASVVNIYKEAAKRPEVREELRNYYSLCPKGHANRFKQRTINLEYDEDFNSWVGPFLMAGINMRVVLRSNAITEKPYAAQFEYNEATLTGNGKDGKKKAKRLIRFARLGFFVLAIAPIRALIAALFLPKPGDGPSPKEQKAGFFDLRFIGKTSKGEEIRVKVTGDRDPGYGSTAKMLAQAALSLRYDVDKTEIKGGFWTPSTVYGEKFLQRLQHHAGLNFEVQSISKTLSDDN